MVGNPDFLTGSGLDQGQEFQEIGAREGESYLRFYIPSGAEFALRATEIREVMEPSPEQITPIPNVSPLLLGTLNLRGRVIWVADLGQFLDDTPLNTDRAEIPVIAVEEQDTILGLAVDQIGGMAWRDAEQLRPPSETSTIEPKLLKGEWVLGEDSGQILRLLNSHAILTSPRWAN